MKKILISFLAIMLISGNAFAYVVQFQDQKAYSGKNGIFEKEKPTSGTFEIDLEEGYIYERSTIINGVDAAKYNPARWKIIENKNGNIVGVRLEGNGEDLICFRNVGTYYIFQAFHDVPIVEEKFMHSFFYGTYVRIDE